MKKLLDDVLKEQTILEFKQRGLEDLLSLFMATYPNYPYRELRELPIDQLNQQLLHTYDTSFLISYIRYSDMELLKSGVRDDDVREKLYFLHHHIGTISSTYRKFIWSELVELEDLKRWLPLLSFYEWKDQILKTTKITESLKLLLDECLDQNSYSYQNVTLLLHLYPQDSIDLTFLSKQNQETFYKFLTIVLMSNKRETFSHLCEIYHRLESLLEQIKIEDIKYYQPMIMNYLRDPFHDQPSLHTIEELEQFQQEQERKCEMFLENEYDMDQLRNFLSYLFLGMSYREFERLFSKIAPSDTAQYHILKILSKAQFPSILKDPLYNEMKRLKDLRPFLEQAILSCHYQVDLQLQKSLFSIDQSRELVPLQGARFTFITMNLKEYQDLCVRKHKRLVEAKVRSNTSFDYEKDTCILSFPASNLVSYDGKSACILKGKNLMPNGIIAFDQISILNVNVQKSLGLPIILIDTERYMEENIRKLDYYFEVRNWRSYIKMKQQLFESIKKHSWLLPKYFDVDVLYEDVKKWGVYLDSLVNEEISKEYLSIQVKILGQLIELNEKIEKFLSNKEKEHPFQYRKIMVQYEKLI